MSRKNILFYIILIITSYFTLLFLLSQKQQHSFKSDKTNNAPLLYVNSRGWSKRILKLGDNIHFPMLGDSVAINYIAKLVDGTIIDNSIEKYGPHSFKIGEGQAIRGWDESILGMSIGEKAIITIDYDYAFGDQGYTQVIPPKAQIITEVELLKITTI